MAGFTITIKKNATIDDVEGYYDLLHKSAGLNSGVDLCLPAELSHDYFGLVPQLLQFVITWIRYKKSKRLLIDLSDTEKETVEDLYKNELIFPSVILAWYNNGVYLASNGEPLSGILNFKNREFITKMMAGESVYHKLLLANFEHLPDEYQLPCFGNRYEFIRTEYNLQQNLRKGISDVFYYATIEPEFVSIYPDLVAIIYELMKNTFEWGKEDENNVPLETNIRGVAAKFFKKTRKALLEDMEGHKGLSGFFGNTGHKENTRGELYFVEISIFDGGIGFNRKYKSSHPDEMALADIDILKKCLIKHNTSAKTLEKDDKGIGLDRILRVLDGKGFLRIKTGQLCVYRDMIANRYEDNRKIESMVLLDWKSQNAERYTKFRNSEGALITILYPLANNI